MYCMGFSTPVRREAEPSGQFYPSIDKQGKAVDNKVAIGPILGLDQTSLLNASSQIVPNHDHGHKNELRSLRNAGGHVDPSNWFQREMDTASSIHLNKGENQHTIGVGVEDKFHIVGMEVLLENEQTLRNHVPFETCEARNDRGSAKRLAMDLQKTSRMLECERSQRQVLMYRIDQMDKQLQELKRSETRSNHFRNGDSIESQIEDFNAVIQNQQLELNDQRARNQELQEELENAKTQNKNLIHQMRLLMFLHIPQVSGKYKDVGSVNYDISESWTQVGKYQLGKKIGEGHYGIVQAGVDSVTRNEYAIKILSKERMSRFKDLQQIAMEVHVLKHFGHPNIIFLNEVIHAPDNIYLVLELCSMDLHSYHTTIGLTEDTAKQVTFGILRALEHLHSNGICHLDLKPENVLLSRSVDIKKLSYEDIRLCDFGLVNMARKPETSKEIIRKGYACGTPGFFAPEMILEKKFEGRTADMWSLGAIILEITLGFTQEWIDSYGKIDMGPIAFKEGLERCLSEIPKEKYPLHQDLLDLIHSSLSIKPANRILAADALKHPWLGSVFSSLDERQDTQNSQKRPNKDEQRPLMFPDLI
ncbi:unnamed protein product [Cylindrotheca closterium]|uniref:Protein kinase domain-containing protein n=1 Tax=Cylindrotheca closterium TaxID=2856 RepID=A0AAD2FZT3_9STRA|nr:unnamed protein product [Cylindrotheca closterium]